MSDPTPATHDPTASAREWAALSDDERADHPDRALRTTEREWRLMSEASCLDDDAAMVRMFATARRVLADAPAMLARLEEAERLLRRGDGPQLTRAAKAKWLEDVATFVLGPSTPRAEGPNRD